MSEDDLPPDLPLMNCAQCGKAMTAKEYADTAREFGLRLFAARIAGRPYCSHCVDSGGRKHSDRTTDRRRAGVTPNAVRDLEDMT